MEKLSLFRVDNKFKTTIKVSLQKQNDIHNLSAFFKPCGTNKKQTFIQEQQNFVTNMMKAEYSI